MSEIHGQTPEEIRADIERKRGEMSRKVDAIQDRFAPDNLKAEARSLAQDVVSESTETIKEFVRTNSAEMGRSLVDSFKRNPVPSALILAGLGWMIFNSTQSSDKVTDSNYGDGRGRGYGPDYDRGYRGRNDPSYSRNYDRSFYADERFAPYYGPNQDYVRGGMDAYSYYGERGYRPEEMQGRYRDARGGGESFMDRAGNIVDRAGNILQHAAERAGSAVASAADAVAGTAKDAVDAVKHTADTVGDAVSDQASRVSNASADATSSLQQSADSVANQVAQTRHQVMDQASEWTDEARRRADDMAQEAQYQMLRAQEAAARTIDENLLTFGALALFAGAAVGLALPATRREREFMGEYSDRFVERTQQVAGDVAQDVRQVAQSVADDVAPKLQQTVADVTEELKQTGKQVTEEVSKGMQQAGDSVREKVQETTGVKVDGAQGNKGANGSSMDKGNTSSTSSTSTSGSNKS